MLRSSSISESESLSSWCRILLGGTLRSLGCGLGVLSSSPFAGRSFPFPPRMSLIMNLERGGWRIAIEPRCKPVIPAISLIELILTARDGLSQPNVFHCSTILENLIYRGKGKVACSLVSWLPFVNLFGFINFCFMQIFLITFFSRYLLCVGYFFKETLLLIHFQEFINFFIIYTLIMPFLIPCLKLELLLEFCFDLIHNLSLFNFSLLIIIF